MKMMRLRTLTSGLGLAILMATSASSAADSFKDCADCPEMIAIPSGKAILGSEPWIADRKRIEGPIREVTIAYTLAIAKTEATRSEYRAFIEATGYQTSSEPGREGCNTRTYDGVLGFVRDHTWDAPGDDQREDHPVTCTSWADAHAYASWLAETTGKPYRLLSSTEFEYATRAGTRGPWFWGTSNADACAYANVADSTFRRLYDYQPLFACDDNHERTSPVGSYQPNPWGLYDMLGNAWEWTEDCVHTDMRKVPTDGRAWREEDEGDCTKHIPRGGSWMSGTDWVRAAAQAGDPTLYHSQILGFRVAVTLDE
ncbi:MAG: SUMF1/EgtB/PvdO family nonheme iron enzyme [Alphaproteobacteria bacterium]|nr:SUMF1/EgtB/PvdO family nonheme iron enzyme [Alphaproteobacteria bacterium]